MKVSSAMGENSEEQGFVFTKGLDLCQQFYFEIIKPIIQNNYALSYTAALIGNGSEILSYDTEMSTDHDWGPRCMLFLEEEDLPRVRDSMDALLWRELPTTYRGYPTLFVPSVDQEGNPNVQVPCTCSSSSGRIGNHKVLITSVRVFVLSQIGYDINSPLEPCDWLSFPQQKLLSLTGKLMRQYYCRIFLVYSLALQQGEFLKDTNVLCEFAHHLQYWIQCGISCPISQRIYGCI